MSAAEIGDWCLRNRYYMTSTPYHREGWVDYMFGTAASRDSVTIKASAAVGKSECIIHSAMSRARRALLKRCALPVSSPTLRANMMMGSAYPLIAADGSMQLAPILCRDNAKSMQTGWVI